MQRKTNTNRNVEVVVIGQARGGKSTLGNKVAKKLTGEKKIFTVSAGNESCTVDINSKLFEGSKVKKLTKGKVDSITYIDTPGFPDTRGLKETIEVYNEIVHYINKEKPKAIVWILQPTRVKDDIDRFRTYSFLMKKFTNKGIYFGILVNNAGDGDMDEEETIEAHEKVRDIIKSYNVDSLTKDDPFISVSAEHLFNAFMSLVLKASEVSLAEEDVGTFLTFEAMENVYTSAFDKAAATENYVQEKKVKIKEIENDIRWHENRIHDLRITIASCAASAAVSTAAGGGFAFFTFGLSAVAAVAAASAAMTAAAGMEIAVNDSLNKIPNLEKNLEIEKSLLANVGIDEVKQIHRDNMNEFAQLYLAIGNKDKGNRILEDMKAI